LKSTLLWLSGLHPTPNPTLGFPRPYPTTDASRSRSESPQRVARFELLGVPKSWQNERLHQMATQDAMRKWRDVTWLAKVM
jgi:hypothetical protein